MKYRWTTATPQPLLAQSLADALKIPPLLAQCLLNRGFSEPAVIKNFLTPRLKNLADPFLLPNMDAAVTRLLRARERGEPLVIFGDYDVDGVTSTTLLLEVLRRLGWAAEAYLPNRLEEGYGLSRDGVENCLKKFPVKLLLAVDCGSTAVETIAWLRERGVDVIVLDHHQVSSPAPAAVALVNPQLTAETGNPKPGIENFQELCSAGLAFKLAHALVKRGRETGLPGAAEFDLRPLLDLVALGTIADLVPLTGESRILATAGLDKLNTTQRPGPGGPEANRAVAGKTRHARCRLPARAAPERRRPAGNRRGPLHLLLAESVAEALPLAQNLDAQNRERQTIERVIVDEVAGTCARSSIRRPISSSSKASCSGTSASSASWRRACSRNFTGPPSSSAAKTARCAAPAAALPGSTSPPRCASVTICCCATAATPWRRA
jgi:single-stranded-DNA-specific exonuclease